MSTAALSADPISISVLLGTARDHHTQNRLREAAECYGEILRASPQSQVALLGLSLLARQSNQFESALKMAQSALGCSVASSAEAALAWAHLGHCLLALGKIEEARAAFEQALLPVDNLSQPIRGQLVDIELRDAEDRRKATIQTGIQAKIQAQIGLGELLSSVGLQAEAVPRFRAAIELEPGLAAGHYGLGSALSIMAVTGAGVAEALASFARAVELAPQSPESHFGVAFLESRLGRHANAVRGYRMAVRCRPNFASAWLNLGVELVADGRDELAEPCYRQAIAVLPADTSTYHAGKDVPVLGLRSYSQVSTEISARLNLGHLFRHRRDFARAGDEYRKALLLAGNLRGGQKIQELAQERIQEVQVAFTYLYIESSDLPRAWASLHRAEAADSGVDEVLDRSVLDRDSESAQGAEFESVENAEVLNARGILILAEEYARIRPSGQRGLIAAGAQPADLESSTCGVGQAGGQVGEGAVERAVRAFEQAEALGHKTAASNRGNALLRIGRCEEALEAHQIAHRIDPLNPGVHYNLALTQLRMGNYEAGWANYEIRWSFRDVHPRPRRFVQPRWMGQASEHPGTSAIRLLLYSEQGLGDTIQFVRFLPLVAGVLTGRPGANDLNGKGSNRCLDGCLDVPATAHLILEVQGPLVRLLKPYLIGLEAHYPGLTAEIVGHGQALPPFTHHCPLLSLAALFKTTVQTVPGPRQGSGGYLDAVPRGSAIFARIAKSGAWLAGELKVGLAWAGNPGYRADYERSTCLLTFLPLLGMPGVRWFSLQKGEAQTEIAEVPEWLRPIDACSQDQDLADTAALMANLDLVISTDTSIAHLAGALGKPLWLLLPWQSDWRWMQEVLTTPWYPTARLFRQTSHNDWGEMIFRVGGELTSLLRSRSSSLETS